MRKKLLGMLCVITWTGGHGQAVAAINPGQPAFPGFFYTISANGIRNGKSTITNDGAPFGIDTPGTTTCGAQEWADSLTYPTNKLNAGGGKALFSPGIYQWSSQLLLSNNFNVGWVLEGVSAEASVIRYSGRTVDGVIRVNSILTNDSQLGFQFRNLSIFSTTNMQGALIRLGHLSQGIIENYALGSWNALTNNGAPWFKGRFQIQHGLLNPGTEIPSLIGIQDDGGQGNSFIIRDGITVNTAVSVYTMVDHIQIYGNSWQANGSYLSKGIVVKGKTTWTNTSPFSLGFAVVVDNDLVNDRNIHDNQCYRGIGDVFTKNQITIKNEGLEDSTYVVCIQPDGHVLIEGGFWKSIELTHYPALDGLGYSFTGGASPSPKVIQYGVAASGNGGLNFGPHFSVNEYGDVVANSILLSGGEIAVQKGGYTSDLLVPGLNGTNVLHITNGIIMGVTRE